jgi:hypothetical protein
VLQGFAQSGGGFDLGQLTGVGDLSKVLAGILPPEAQTFIPNIVQGIYGAFSLATAQAFWLGVFGSAVAFVAALAIKEIPLRSTNEAPVPTQTVAQSAAPATGLGRPATSADGPAAAVSGTDRPTA